MTMTTSNKSYPLKTRKLKSICSVVFYSAITWLVLSVALTNNRGTEFTIPGMTTITFTAQVTTVFYWILSAACFAVVVAGLSDIYKSFFVSREIVMLDDGIMIPSGKLFSKKVINLKYEDIKTVDMYKFGRLRLIKMLHTKGKLVINDLLLEQKSDFVEIMQTIESNVNA